MSELLLVGRIARAHGNKGQVIVNPDTDFPEERYKPGSTVYIQRNGALEPLVITAARFCPRWPVSPRFDSPNIR